MSLIIEAIVAVLIMIFIIAPLAVGACALMWWWLDTLLALKDKLFGE